MIVGRDTENLTEEGVTKAAVETVAENTSDGVTAPLIYLLIGGRAARDFCIRQSTRWTPCLDIRMTDTCTLDCIPARMDDIFNYIPARLTALVMIAAAYLTGLDGRNAWRIYRRDRNKHASPNAAQTESVCAGALGVQLAGDAVYFGKLYKKEFIGDSLRPIEPQDIRGGHRVLMYVTAFLLLLLCGGIKAALIF